MIILEKEEATKSGKESEWEREKAIVREYLAVIMQTSICQYITH